MKNEELTNKLMEEISKGNVAKHVYDSYLKNYIEAKRLAIFNEFCSCGESDKLVFIKQRQVALDELEQDTITTIETMMLAQKQLGTNDG